MIEDLKNITEELEQCIQSARDSISDAAMENNWDKAQAITSAAKGLEEVTKKVTSLRKDIRKAINEFDVATRSHTKEKHTKLHITIRWVLAGENKADELIDDDSASDAMSHFILSLVEILGEGILPKIAQIPIGNSGLVSQDPKGEFRNPNNNNVYGHRTIGETGWAVKIHSSTVQKSDQIMQVAARLGMPQRAVDVEIVEK